MAKKFVTEPPDDDLFLWLLLEIGLINQIPEESEQDDVR